MADGTDWVDTPLDPGDNYDDGSGDDACLDGEGMVLMADGALKRAVEVLVGDAVATSAHRQEGDNATAVVTATWQWGWDAAAPNHLPVVLTPAVGSATGAWITDLHPLRDPATGAWLHPKDLPAASSPASARPARLTLCNFVLDRGHALVFAGIEATTLGGGHDNPARNVPGNHGHYWDGPVVDNMRRMSGWPNIRGKVPRYASPASKGKSTGPDSYATAGGGGEEEAPRYSAAQCTAP
jgi:hypothetical protein